MAPGGGEDRLRSVKPKPSTSVGYAAAFAFVAAAIALLKLLPHTTDATTALCLLVSVFLVAWIWESGPGALAALLATLGFNFFFLPPLFTFTIAESRNVVALFVFLGAGLLVGRLSAIGRLRLRQIETERGELIALTDLSQAFLSDANRESLAGLAASRLQRALGCRKVAILIGTSSGALERRVELGEGEIREDLADLAWRQGNSAAFPSELGGLDLYLPIPLGVQRIGCLALRGLERSERMAEGCAALLGLAFEREKFLRLTREAEEIRVREELKSTFLAALAHDLKTPVATALGATENWEAESGESDKSRQVRDALGRLRRLVDDLMNVVRLESGSAAPHLERVGCEAVVEAVVARYGDALAERPFSVEVPPAGLEVLADPAQLTEAIGLGLENAARHSRPGSPIRISACLEGGTVLFRVDDAGPGIPPEARGRVLGKFVRLEGGGVAGSGLGLYIAQQLVSLGGGSLRLLDSPEGGTRFEIAIPEVGR